MDKNFKLVKEWLVKNQIEQTLNHNLLQNSNYYLIDQFFWRIKMHFVTDFNKELKILLIIEPQINFEKEKKEIF